MAYDRYDRDERSRWPEDRSERSFRGDNRLREDYRGRDERGFWDRASDEVASWFGDDEAERRRQQDRTHEDRERGYGGRSREQSAFRRGSAPDRDDRGYGRDLERDTGRRDWCSRRKSS